MAGVLCKEHPGIGCQEILKELRHKLNQPELGELIVTDYFDLARGCGIYSECIEKMSEMREEQLHYLGIALWGSKKMVNKLTGSLPLLKKK